MYLNLLSLPISWRLILVGIVLPCKPFLPCSGWTHQYHERFLGDLTPVASICSWERYGLPASSKGGKMCLFFKILYTFTHSDMGCLCWSVLKKEHDSYLRKLSSGEKV